MIFRKVLAAGLSALMVAAASPAFAGVQYFYDRSGRLIRAVYSNGVTVEYRYDATGNRTQVITTNVPNAPPSAVNDTAAVNGLQSVDIYVRLNDSDPNGNSLTITSVSAPTGGGSAVIRGGGTYVRYTAPASGGTKTFTYVISDGVGGTDTATVSVAVTATSQPPVAQDDSATVNVNESIAVMVLGNDSDPNNDALTVTTVDNVNGGSASIAPGGGYIIYYAPPSPGSYTLDYTISDGNGGTASATIHVTVEGFEGCVPQPGQMCEVDP